MLGLHSFLSKKKASGALMDSLKIYFQRSSRLGEMGLVWVGDVYGVKPKRLASIRSLSMWNGSLTRRAL
jgi:hypothetical protein